MKPQSAEFLEKSRQFLAKAQDLLEAHRWPDAYNLKAIADYQTGPGSQVSAASARETIATARRFVEGVASLIPPDD